MGESEEYTGLYLVLSTQASILHSVIRDVLQKINLTITKLRGQCYDGAISMYGIRSGVAKKILEEVSRTVFTHCYGYVLNIACSDGVKGCKSMKNALDTAYEIIMLVKKSSHHEAMLQNIKQHMEEDSPGIRVLGPTRWTVCAQALQSIIANYNILQSL